MSDILTVMLWPFLACLLLPWLLVYYGLHIVKREIIFVDLALAQDGDPCPRADTRAHASAFGG